MELNCTTILISLEFFISSLSSYYHHFIIFGDPTYNYLSNLFMDM